MALNPDRIDAAFYEALRSHYSDEEIVELGAFIGFNIGYHTFFGTLKFYPMFAPDGRLVTQEESARIYGDVPVSLQSASDPSEAPRPRPAAGTRPPGPSSRLPGESRDPEYSPKHPTSTPPHATRHSLSRLEPIPPEHIDDAELRTLVERASALGVPGARFSGILARSPVHAKAVLHAMIESHFRGGVDHRLKEVIRIRLARTAGDRHFAGLRSRRAKEAGLDEATIEAGCGRFEADARFDPPSQWALRFARDLYLAPENIDAAFYAEGKRHWSEGEIMELGAFSALHYGMQAFMRVL